MDEKHEKSDLLKKFHSIRQHTYLLFEEPNSSIYSKIICYFILSLILVSTVMIINDSLPVAEEDSYQENGWYVDTSISIVFLIELLLRLFSWSAYGGETKAFFKDFSNVLDTLAVLPFFFELGLEGDSSFKKLKIVRAIRFSKIFRLFKVSRYLRGIVLLEQGLKRSIRPVLNYLVIVMSFSLCLPVLIYYIESSSSNDDSDAEPKIIKSIPEAFWWSLATLTTVGYGDKIPQSIGGKLLAGSTAILGVVLLSMPVSVLGKSIADVYNEQAEIDKTSNIKDKYKKISRGIAEENDISQKLVEDLEFLRFRMEIMKENDLRIKELLEHSREVYEHLNDDISALYHILHQQFDILDIKSATKTLARMSFKKKTKYFARMQQSKRKLRVNTISQTERSWEKDSLDSSQNQPKQDYIIKSRVNKHSNINQTLKNLFKVPTNLSIEEALCTPKSKPVERDNARVMSFSSLVQRSRQMTATGTTNYTHQRKANKNFSNFSNRSFDKHNKDLSDERSEVDLEFQEDQEQISGVSIEEEPPHQLCTEYNFFDKRDTQFCTTEDGQF